MSVGIIFILTGVHGTILRCQKSSTLLNFHFLGLRQLKGNFWERGVERLGGAKRGGEERRRIGKGENLSEKSFSEGKRHKMIK